MGFFSTRSAKKPVQPSDLSTDSNAAIEIDLIYEGIATEPDVHCFELYP